MLSSYSLQDILDFFRRPVVAIIAAVLVVGGLGSAIVVMVASHANSMPKGYTATATLPSVNPHAAHSAAPRPTDVAKIFASGDCGKAFTTMRAFMSEHRSGLTVPASADAQMNADMAAIRSKCTPDKAASFQTQELQPWLNAAVPGAVVGAVSTPTTPAALKK